MDQVNKNNDKFARESFGMRGMKDWQVWGVTIIGIAVVAALIGYVVV